MVNHSGSPSDLTVVRTRLAAWRSARNYVAIGNLGEHVTGRLLVALGYEILGAQDDFLGMVPDVLNMSTTAKPEDFIVIDPDDRLVTVNSKASISVGACRITSTGDLATPQIGRGQRDVAYTTLRANLISPLDGDASSQVVKVDLVNMKAQIFEIGDDERLTRVGPVHDIADAVVDILEAFADSIPPPTAGDLT